MVDCCTQHVTARGWPTCVLDWELEAPVTPLLWREEAKAAGADFALHIGHHSKKKWFVTTYDRIVASEIPDDRESRSAKRLRVSALVGFQKVAGLLPRERFPDDPIIQVPLWHFGAGFAQQLSSLPEVVDAIRGLGRDPMYLHSPPGWTVYDAARAATRGLEQYFNSQVSGCWDPDEFEMSLASVLWDRLTDNDRSNFFGLPGFPLPLHEEHIRSLLTKEKQRDMEDRDAHRRKYLAQKTLPCQKASTEGNEAAPMR
jgi:hypothetical protein